MEKNTSPGRDLSLVANLSSTVTVPRASAAPDIAPGGAEEAAQQLVLLQRLMGCVDTETLLQIFLRWCSDVSLADGLAYISPEGGAEMRVGHRKLHSANYTLALNGEKLGALTLYRRQRFAEPDLLRLESILGSVARCLQSAIAFGSVKTRLMRDSLTELGNRDALSDSMARELSRAHRYGEPLALLMIDVDHFKQFNDNLGHLAGDAVLKSIADVLRQSTRRSDLLFRYGGDEFIVLLPHTDRVTAERVGEKIRDNLVAVEQPVLGGLGPAKEVQLDVSIGVASFRPDDTAERLIQRADERLYAVKQNGRGAVCASD